MNEHNKACLVIGDQDFMTAVRTPLGLTGLTPIGIKLSSFPFGGFLELEIKGLLYQLVDCTMDKVDMFIGIRIRYPEVKAIVVFDKIDHVTEKKLREHDLVFLGDLESFYAYRTSIIQSAFMP